jgi:hypothetical protein
MKKTMIILIGLMLSAISFAQPGPWIVRLSESEIDKEYIKWNEHYTTTTETYIKLFIDKYHVDAYNTVIDSLETGGIDKYIQTLRDKGFIEMAEDVHDLKYADSLKTTFVSKGKLYVMTYEPVRINNLGSIVTKNICIYRRDNDGMKLASNVICKDHYVKDAYTKEHIINSDCSESLYKIADSIIVIVCKVNEWNFHHDINNYVVSNYNAVTLLVPDGNDGYFATYFEPDNKVPFDVNKVESTSTNDGLILKYESGTIEFKIFGDDIRVGGTIRLTPAK